MVKHKLTQANYNAMRDRLFTRVHKNGEELKNDFPNILRTVIEAEAWKHFTDGEGKPFPNLVAWLHYTFPHGVSMGQGQHAITYDDALALTKGATDVHKVLAQNAPEKGRGGDRKSKAAKNQTLSTTFDRSGSGSVITLSARLAQEKPKIYDAYLRGEYKTITAAATAAGLLKNDVNLRRAKSAFRMMTAAQRDTFLEWMKTEASGNGTQK